MRTDYRFLLIALLTLTASVVASADDRLPTFGLYIVNSSHTDVLADIMPTLSRIGFAETVPRELTGEHLPVATLKNADDDELQAVVGRGCVLLEFNLAEAPIGPERDVAMRRLKAVHDRLEQYFSKLPEPRPRILTAVPIPDGCPNEF
jgi:hypothetical protein